MLVEFTVGIDGSVTDARVLRAAPPTGKPHEVEVETITVRERMLAVMEALGVRGSLELDDLVARADGGPASRAILVATFLALLELCRIAAIRVYQGMSERGCPQGPIHVRVAGEGDEWRLRIAEIM